MKSFANTPAIKAKVTRISAPTCVAVRNFLLEHTSRVAYTSCVRAALLAEITILLAGAVEDGGIGEEGFPVP